MKFAMLVIFDQVAGVFLQPFFARSSVDGMRQLRHGKDDPGLRDTPIGREPEKFSLYHVGDFDDESAEVAPRLPHVYLGPISEIFADSPRSSTVPS